MTELALTSTLEAAHEPAIERLLFFHPDQDRSVECIRHVVERYGRPKLRIVRDRIVVEVASRVQTQTLFVTATTPEGDMPVGIMVYTREGDAFVVLFVVVHEAFCRDGPRASERLLQRMVTELQAIARRVKGVERLVLYLGRKTPVSMRVRR